MKLLIKTHNLFRTVCLATLLFAATATLCAADDDSDQPSHFHYLTAGQPVATALLAPPPAANSPEQRADIDEVRAVFRGGSVADKEAAYSEKKFSIFNFALAAGPFFTEANLPKTAAFFKKVQKDAAAVTDSAKDYYHRPRPYTADPSLANGKLEKSFSYPSGHSTESMVLGLVLADVMPEKREAILTHARAMGWHRVQIARHYPTDIYAGRVLAQSIVAEMKKSPKFERDFAEAKAEIAATQQAARN